MIDVGEQVGEIILQDHNGTQNSLNTSRRKVIFCYPKASTPGWTIEATEFQSIIKKFEKGNIDIYGLSADPPKALKTFVKKCGLTYSLLSDESHIILKKLGVWGVKKMYGREYEGIIRRTIVLDENNVVTHTFPKVSPKGHAKEVAKAIGL